MSEVLPFFAETEVFILLATETAGEISVWKELERRDNLVDFRLQGVNTFLSFLLCWAGTRWIEVDFMFFSFPDSGLG